MRLDSQQSQARYCQQFPNECIYQEGSDCHADSPNPSDYREHSMECSLVSVKESQQMHPLDRQGFHLEGRFQWLSPSRPWWSERLSPSLGASGTSPEEPP